MNAADPTDEGSTASKNQMLIGYPLDTVTARDNLRFLAGVAVDIFAI